MDSENCKFDKKEETTTTGICNSFGSSSHAILPSSSNAFNVDVLDDHDIVIDDVVNASLREANQNRNILFEYVGLTMVSTALLEKDDRTQNHFELSSINLPSSSPKSLQEATIEMEIQSGSMERCDNESIIEMSSDGEQEDILLTSFRAHVNTNNIMNIYREQERDRQRQDYNNHKSTDCEEEEDILLTSFRTHVQNLKN